MEKWKDVTTFSRGDKECIPTTFTLIAGGIDIIVTSGHIHYKGQWVMHCYVLNMDTVLLEDCTSLKQAKELSIKMVRSKLESLLNDIKELGE